MRIGVVSYTRIVIALPLLNSVRMSETCWIAQAKIQVGERKNNLHMKEKGIPPLDGMPVKQNGHDP